MVTVPVHKDIYAYEPKVLFILTARTLAFTAVALALGIAVGAVCLGPLGLSTDVAIYPIMLVSLPVFFFGYARPFKMKPEELVPYMLRAYFLPQNLTYSSNPSVTGELREAGHARELIAGRRPQDAEKQPAGVQRHYAEIRRQRGVEGFYPAEPLF